MARILDGRKISDEIKQGIWDETKILNKAPQLAIITATDNESTGAYVRMIKRTADKVGIETRIINLDKDADHKDFCSEVKKCAEDKDVNGIIIQTPVPSGVDADELRSLIPVGKDVDGANPLSAGRLFSGLEAFAPATAQAVIEILKYYDIKTEGSHAVVIGRSRIVGKPVANMLLGLDSTVSMCHSLTRDLAEFTTSADILVVAAGKADLIGKDHINKDRQTVVIDVGTNFTGEGKMVGDVNFEQIKDEAGALTPVPGGVGPVTTALLLKNTLNAYKKQIK